jgi:hypothetical protein
VVRAALASYESHIAAERRFVLTACAEGDGRPVSGMPEEELLQGFGG